MSVAVCKYCGKTFSCRSGTKFCSSDCRIKYHKEARRNVRVCLACGKSLDIGQAKYCDKNCRQEYLKANPRYEMVCEWCGTAFKTNNHGQKRCSKKCGYAVQMKPETTFKQEVELKYPDFEYASGYTGWRSFVTLRCRACGQTQERTAQIIKPEVSSNILCDYCIQLKSQRRQLIVSLGKRLRKANAECHKIEIIDQKQVERKHRLESMKDYTCEECGMRFDATYTSQKYCSDACRNRHHNRIKIIRKNKKIRDNGNVDYSITIEKLISRDNNICYLCGSVCNESDYTVDSNDNFIAGNLYPSIDHVTAVNNGGTHTWSNVKLAHRYCNSVKSDKELKCTG